MALVNIQSKNWWKCDPYPRTNQLILVYIGAVFTLITRNKRIFLLSFQHHLPSYDKHQLTPHQETKIPVNPLIRSNSLIDMMQAQYVMVNNTLHHVEYAKTQQ